MHTLMIHLYCPFTILAKQSFPDISVYTINHELVIEMSLVRTPFFLQIQTEYYFLRFLAIIKQLCKRMRNTFGPHLAKRSCCDFTHVTSQLLWT